LHTQFDLARAAGVGAHVVSQPEFAGTGLTSAAFRGAEYVGATGADELAAGILDVVHRGTGRDLVYGYLNDVDRAGHGLAIEQSALFTSLVGEWVDRVEGASSS